MGAKMFMQDGFGPRSLANRLKIHLQLLEHEKHSHTAVLYLLRLIFEEVRLTPEQSQAVKEEIEWRSKTLKDLQRLAYQLDRRRTKWLQRANERMVPREQTISNQVSGYPSDARLPAARAPHQRGWQSGREELQGDRRKTQASYGTRLVYDNGAPKGSMWLPGLRPIDRPVQGIENEHESHDSL